MAATGLLEVWTESDMLSKKTADNVMSGKDYEKAMRAHKITSQGLWYRLLPQLMQYLQLHHPDIKQAIEVADIEDENVEMLDNMFQSNHFRTTLDEFISSRCDDPNFML